MNAEQMFKNYRGIIRKRAWEYAKRYNMEFSELESEGHVIFCEALETFDNEKASFSTHLYWELGALKAFCEKEVRRTRGHSSEPLEFVPERSEIGLEEKEKPSFIDHLSTLEGDTCVLVHAILEDDLSSDEAKTSWKKPNRTSAGRHFSDWNSKQLKSAWSDARSWWHEYESKSL